MPNMEWNMGKS